MHKPWIALTAALLLASPGVYAAGIGKGDFEAGLSISISQTEIDIEGFGTTDSDTGIIELSGGYFFSDQLQFLLSLSEVISSDFTYGTLAPGVDWMFVTGGSTVVPFAGAAFALGLQDNPTDYLEVHGGVKYFFREDTSVEARLSYASPTDSAFDAYTDLTVGINIYF
ncbi:MAG: hypothetical protein ACRETF_04520 [Nevskiaceae bacterium]